MTGWIPKGLTWQSVYASHQHNSTGQQTRVCYWEDKRDPSVCTQMDIVTTVSYTIGHTRINKVLDRASNLLSTGSLNTEEFQKGNVAISLR